MGTFQDGNTYVDRPRPGIGYLMFASVPTVGPLIALPFLSSSDYVPFFVLYSLWFSVWFVPLCATVNTKYLLGLTELKVRSGVFRKAIPMGEIHGVERTRFNQRTQGWGSGVRGYCNRLSNGIRLDTSMGYICLSPTDPETFVSMLRTHILQKQHTQD